MAQLPELVQAKLALVNLALLFWIWLDVMTTGRVSDSSECCKGNTWLVLGTN